MTKCTRKAWCTSMSRHLAPLANQNAKGLSVFVLMQLSTGKDIVAGVRYRNTARDPGVLLNCCPWCGARVDYIVQDSKQKKGKAA